MESLSSYLKSSLAEDKVAKQLKNAIVGMDGVSFVHDYQYPFSRRIADFMLLYNNQLLAAIEVKNNLENLDQVKRGEQQLEAGRLASLLRFGILTDGTKIILFDWWFDKAQQDKSDQSLAEVIEYIYAKKEETILQANYERSEKGKEAFYEVFKKEFPDFPIERSNIEMGKKETIKLNKDVEQKLFNTLFPPFDDSELCRFTMLSSFFETVKNNSYRMCATEGMNDIEDGTFLWKKLYGDMSKEDLLPQNRDTIFILSCSPIKAIEDLTMWRLYGDDTKGVCLVYDIGDNAQNDGFYLRKVKYDGDSDIIEKFESLTKDFFKETKLTFVFNYWDLWSAFVKSKEYAVEEEIRLAYIPSLLPEKNREKHWLLTKSNQIISEYLDFKESATAPFPLKLKKVWLGASCPEQRVNTTQLQNMIDSSDGFKDKNIIVSPSEITNYRPALSK